MIIIGLEIYRECMHGLETRLLFNFMRTRDGAVVRAFASHQCVPGSIPGFDSRTWFHMWVKFVVGSLLCSERFFFGYSGFRLSLKTNISWNARVFLNEFFSTFWCSVGKKGTFTVLHVSVFLWLIALLLDTRVYFYQLALPRNCQSS